MLALELLLVAVLIAATAFFVATEFAMVRLRSSRVSQLVIEGKKNSLALQKVTSNLDGYLSACQLGITITALALGALGEPAIHKLLDPLFHLFNLPEQIGSIVSFVIVFSIITYLHVVVGELAPKTLAIQKAEEVSLLCAPIIVLFYKILYPFIWLLNGSANFIIRLFGLRPASEHEDAHSEEELRMILSESYRSGKINQAEYGYVNRIFEFDEMLAREIMIPRTDMVCLHVDQSLEENMKTIKKEQYTRFPVMDEDKDHILGMINTKRFFLRCHDNPQLNFREQIQPILTVPDSIAVKTLLKQMQFKETHLALLIDEYGGTSGMVTIEDILEEIVGEIRDEFDKDEKKEIEKIAENHYILEGKVSLSIVRDLFHLKLEHTEFETIGGWLYSQNNDLETGSEWTYKQLHFVILEKTTHRIAKVEVRKQGAIAADPSTQKNKAEKSNK